MLLLIVSHKHTHNINIVCPASIDVLFTCIRKMLERAM